jgi:hypothetical protein
MKFKLKKLYYYYQRVMFYVGKAKGEINKPLQLSNETLLLITFLSVRGINVGIFFVISIYLLVIFILAIFGIIFVKTGTIRYNNSLDNGENNELQKILVLVTKIDEKIEELKIDSRKT